jgi:hydroxyacylglutathione hydrolase
VLIRQFAIEGLGHLSALVADDSAGVAVVVDPRRDVDVYLEEARRLDLRISHVLETHLHNDYVSGARDLAALTGASHAIGAGAGLRYEHRPVRGGEAVETGVLRFVAIDTPGHTPEHVAWALSDTSRAEEPVVLFTGGSLLVGAVGRTDLLGADNAVPFARSMFRSLHDELLTHEDYVAVYPTHGAGSLCSTGISSTPWSTIGFERRHNPMLQPTDIDEFARRLLDGQPAFPRYFARMRPTNLAGPALLGGRVPEARPMTMTEAQSAVAEGALVVDLRRPADFAMEHVPGSISIPAGSSFGTWLGWVVEHDRPLVLLLEDPAEWDDAIRQALRIGYDTVLGHLRGGFRAWVEAGGAVESSGRLTVHQLADNLGGDGDREPLVIDVRQPSEFAAGHVEGAVHIAAGDLQERLASLPRDRPIAAMCASGYRASVAASLLRQAGFRDVSWVADGLPAWEAAGLPVTAGAPLSGEHEPERAVPRERADHHSGS